MSSFYKTSWTFYIYLGQSCSPPKFLETPRLHVHYYARSPCAHHVTFRSFTSPQNDFIVVGSNCNTQFFDLLNDSEESMDQCYRLPKLHVNIDSESPKYKVARYSHTWKLRYPVGPYEVRETDNLINFKCICELK